MSPYRTPGERPDYGPLPEDPWTHLVACATFVGFLVFTYVMALALVNGLV